MGGNEVHVWRQVRGHVADHRALHRADVGHDRALGKVRTDLLRDGAAGADRNADDHEISADNGGGVAVDHLVGELQFRDAPARGLTARGGDDLGRQVQRPHGAGDRGADQTGADQGEALEQRLRGHLRAPRARMASSLACAR